MHYSIPYHRPLVYCYGSHMLSNGDKVRELEEAIKELYDVEYVIACSSGSIGLLICIGGLMEASTPAFGWKSVEEIIYMIGFKPRYVDIDKNTWLANEDCTIPVHTFGNIIEMKDMDVIYDGAHALGSKIRDFGKATVFSLAPTKLVTACEGGLILTNESNVGDFCRKRRDLISRMSEPNAAYGLETLNSLDTILEWKRMLFNYYSANLPGVFQQIPYNSNYNTIGFLTDLKIPPHIECKKYYEPLDFSLPNTKFVYNHIVCLPSWYGVDYEKVVDDILSYSEALKSGKIKSFVSEM